MFKFLRVHIAFRQFYISRFVQSIEWLVFRKLSVNIPLFKARYLI